MYIFRHVYILHTYFLCTSMAKDIISNTSKESNQWNIMCISVNGHGYWFWHWNIDISVFSKLIVMWHCIKTPILGSSYLYIMCENQPSLQFNVVFISIAVVAHCHIRNRGDDFLIYTNIIVNIWPRSTYWTQLRRLSCIPACRQLRLRWHLRYNKVAALWPAPVIGVIMWNYLQRR